MASYHIDEIDQKILSFLVKNARMPFLEIARECGVSGAAIHQRFKRLEANGVITGSRLQVKPQALGLNVCAYVSISLSESTKYPEVIANLKKIPEIVECHFVTGKYAILAKLYCLDNDHLMEVLLNTIQKIPYIQSTDTMISLDEPIERQVWVKDFKSTTSIPAGTRSRHVLRMTYYERSEESIIALASTRSSGVVILILYRSPSVKVSGIPYRPATEASSVKRVSYPCV